MRKCVSHYAGFALLLDLHFSIILYALLVNCPKVQLKLLKAALMCYILARGRASTFPETYPVHVFYRHETCNAEKSTEENHGRRSVVTCTIVHPGVVSPVPG